MKTLLVFILLAVFLPAQLAPLPPHLQYSRSGSWSLSGSWYIFGYSARDFSKGIGKAVEKLNLDFPVRCWIRNSTNKGGEMTASNIPVKGGIVCPEQTGKTSSCLTCGLCWSVRKPIQFLTH